MRAQNQIMVDRLMSPYGIFAFDSKKENFLMNAKAAAKQVIDGLPKSVSMDDVIHALYVATKFDRGEREIRAGKGVSDEVAKSRMKKWQR
jgi:hypothetical protein